MKLKHTRFPALLVCLLSTAPITLPAAVEQVQPHSRGASLKLTEGRLQVEFVTDRIARVRATKNSDWSKVPSLMRVEVAEVPGRIQVKESPNVVELRSAKLVVRLERATEAPRARREADHRPLHWPQSFAPPLNHQPLPLLARLPLLLALASISICPAEAAGATAEPRRATLLNSGWRTIAGETNTTDQEGFERPGYDDDAWLRVDVPHNFNGKPAGQHAGGRTTFTLDVTDLVAFGEANRLAVRADHPAGIQNLPWVCDGCSTKNGLSGGSQPMGIFRPVHLVTTDVVRVDPFGIHAWNDETATRDAAVVHVATEVRNYDTAARTVTLETRVRDRQGRAAATLWTVSRPRARRRPTESTFWQPLAPFVRAPSDLLSPPKT